MCVFYGVIVNKSYKYCNGSNRLCCYWLTPPSSKTLLIGAGMPSDSLIFMNPSSAYGLWFVGVAITCSY